MPDSAMPGFDSTGAGMVFTSSSQAFYIDEIAIDKSFFVSFWFLVRITYYQSFQ